MVIGVPKEMKPFEFRVALTPDGVGALVKRGHKVLVESKAGVMFEDSEYEAFGAEITDKHRVFTESDFIYKVKEIFPEEFQYMRENLIVMTYLHSNAHREETDCCLENKVVGVAYEDIQDKNGKFPLLRPMSEIAGKGGFIAACYHSQNINGGSGKMLARLNGIKTPHVTVIGSGSVGLGAAEAASAFGNRVTVLDIDIDGLIAAKNALPMNVEFLYSDDANIKSVIKDTDALINCVSWPKWRTDHLVCREDLKTMKKDAIIVDVACDEGGAIETCRCTTHEDPVYYEEGIKHFCVDNIPSAYARSASEALCKATLPYVIEIVSKGVEKAMIENPLLRKGLSFYNGFLTLEETGRKQHRPYISPEKALGME